MKIRKTKQIMLKCFKDLNPKKVLDIGICKCRCSRGFVEKGAKVTGIDIKEMELPKEIKFILSDIRKYEFKEKYDLIIASLVLYFFKKPEAFEVILKIKENTLVNGFNFILNMNPDDANFKKRSDNFYVTEEKLKELYSDWEIMKSGFFETPLEEHSDIPYHKHNISYVLAKRLK